MIPALPRRAGPWPERFRVPMLSVFAALIFAAAARAQLPLLNPTATRSSISGQFIVIGVNPDLPRERPPLAVTNAEFVRLQPALLAVSAERVKQPLWNWLGLGPGAQWQGRIYLALHPAASLDENVAIMSIRYAGAWNYRVELPDALSRTRLVRALTGVVLLELANRGNPGDRSAEIPRVAHRGPGAATHRQRARIDRVAAGQFGQRRAGKPGDGRRARLGFARAGARRVVRPPRVDV